MSIWNWLFGKKENPAARGEVGSTGEREAVKDSAKGFEVTASVLTDIGCVREINEDKCEFTRPQDPDVLQAKGMLALVADGMGGYSGGEIASSMVIASVPRSYYESPLKPHEALKEAFEKVNQEIHQAASSDATLDGMGTTAVALAICGNQAYAAYVGDSRLYLIRAGRIYQMTQDHSLVSDLVRQGLLSPDDARNHEDRNVLVRSLGGRPAVEVSVWDEPITLREDDRFLLCSDGLHDLVDSDEMVEIVREAGDTAAGKLIETAKQRGGYDNVTVALLHIGAIAGVPAPELRATREIQAQEA